MPEDKYLYLQDEINKMKGNLDECKGEVEERLDEGQHRMDELSQKMDDLKLANDKIIEEFATFKSNIGEMLDIFRSAKGFIKFMGWIGKLVKWVIGLGVVIGVAWANFKGWIKG